MGAARLHGARPRHHGLGGGRHQPRQHRRLARQFQLYRRPPADRRHRPERAAVLATGPNLPATMETAEVHLAKDSRTFVNDAYPLDDVSSVDTGQIAAGTRAAGDPVVSESPVTIEITGCAALFSSSRLHRFRRFIPASAVWNHAQGVRVAAQQDGSVGVKGVAWLTTFGRPGASQFDAGAATPMTRAWRSGSTATAASVGGGGGGSTGAGAWSAFVPVLAAGPAPSPGAGRRRRYWRNGKLIHFQARITITTTGQRPASSPRRCRWRGWCRPIRRSTAKHVQPRRAARRRDPGDRGHAGAV